MKIGREHVDLIGDDAGAARLEKSELERTAVVGSRGTQGPNALVPARRRLKAIPGIVGRAVLDGKNLIIRSDRAECA
jgi:hypothetical protein